MSKYFTPLFFSVLVILFLVISMVDVTLWFMGDVSDSDYFILLDSGASMSARDLTPDRFEVGKMITTYLVDDLGNVNLGFISFGGTISESVDLTQDKSKIKNAIDRSKITNTGTDLSLAIISAIEGFSDSNKSKTIILISDGHDTVGLPLSTGIKKSIEQHVKIITIGVGTQEGGNFLNVPYTVDLISKLDENNLRLLANLTDGDYYNIRNWSQNEIENKESRGTILNTINNQSQKGFVPVSLTKISLIIVLCLVFISWILNNTRFRVFP